MKKGFMIKKDTLNDIIFFLSLGIFLIITILDSSFFCKYFSSDVVKTIIFFSILLIIIKEILTKKIKLKELIYLMVSLILSLLTIYHMSNISILPIFFLIYGGKNIKLEKILKFTGIITAIMLFAIIISSKLNLIENYVYYSNDRIREYLGFRYCLFPPMYMFNISAISLYLHKNKFSFLNVIILTVLNYIIFKYTVSRLSFYLYILLLFGYLVLSNVKCYKIILKLNITRKIIVISYIIIAMISFGITMSYTPTNKTLYNLNNKLENRLYLGKTAINNIGIKLLGNNVKFVGNGLGRNGLKSTKEYNYVDCLPITITIKYGVMFLLLYLLIHTISLYNINEKNDLLLLYIMFILALHGIIDDLGIELYYNAFWFAIGTNILKKIRKQI